MELNYQFTTHDILSCSEASKRLTEVINTKIPSETLKKIRLATEQTIFDEEAFEQSLKYIKRFNSSDFVMTKWGPASIAKHPFNFPGRSVIDFEEMVKSVSDSFYPLNTGYLSRQRIVEYFKKRKKYGKPNFQSSQMERYFR